MPSLYTQKSAFTLLEIILVVIVLSVIVGLAVPNFSPTYHKMQLKNTVNEIAYVMRYAQSRAMTRGIQVRLEFDDQEGRYWLAEELQDRIGHGDHKEFERFNGRLGRTFKIPADFEVIREIDVFNFYPNGRIEKGEMKICAAQYCMIISSKEQRGIVHVFNETNE